MIDAYIRGDHADYRRRLNLLDNLLHAVPETGEIPPSVPRAFRSLANEIFAHQKAEESVVYQALKVKLDGRLRFQKSKVAFADLMDGLGDHRRVDVLTMELLKPGHDAGIWADKFRDLRATLENHWVDEEACLAKACATDLTDRESADLVNRFIESKFTWLGDLEMRPVEEFCDALDAPRSLSDFERSHREAQRNFRVKGLSPVPDALELQEQGF